MIWCSTIVLVVLAILGTSLPLAITGKKNREQQQQKKQKAGMSPVAKDLIAENPVAAPQVLPDEPSIETVTSAPSPTAPLPTEAPVKVNPPVPAAAESSLCCPADFSGWRALEGCTGAMQCLQGQIVSNLECPAGTKWDDSQNYCSPNPFTCTAQKCMQDPSEFQSVERPQQCCPSSDFSGFRAYNSCRSFYVCVNGEVVGPTIDCPPGNIFDIRVQNCRTDVTQCPIEQDACHDGTPVASPVAAPVRAPVPQQESPVAAPVGGEMCCPTGFSGLRPLNNCRSYYQCLNGKLTGSPSTCSEGMLFDEAIQNCNWEASVSMCNVDRCGESKGGQQPKPPVAPAPVAPPRVTPAPTRTPQAAPIQPLVSPPVPPPVQSSPDLGLVREDNRMIAYLGNWQKCPTTTQLAQYSHVIIAFAVTYRYNPTKNICNPDCFIDVPPVCNNAPNTQLIQDLHRDGKRVILSFGGAGMGGSWHGDVNDCWETCFGREQQTVDRLVEIVEQLDLDGVDIDYEYFVEDNQRGSGFTKGAEAQTFLREVTLGLREKLPTGSILTHAPMDIDVTEGTDYFNLLKDVSHTLDFLMPQYYNGITRPAALGFNDGRSNVVPLSGHFNAIVNQFFNGDATRLVTGFCISDCATTMSNADGESAADVMTQIAEVHPCHGGAFFWVVERDEGGGWSQTVNKAMDPTRGCSGAPVVIQKQPTPSPTFTSAPTITMAPSNKPVPEPKQCCPNGFSGFRGFRSCTHYYRCLDGNIIGTTGECPFGTIFDDRAQNCNWESEVPTCIEDLCLQ